MRAALPETDNFGGSEQSGKSICQVYDYKIITNTFTTQAFGEI